MFTLAHKRTPEIEHAELVSGPITAEGARSFPKETPKVDDQPLWKHRRKKNKFKIDNSGALASQDQIWVCHSDPKEGRILNINYNQSSHQTPLKDILPA